MKDPLNVLLVDDEEAFLSVLTRRLTKRELRIFNALSGEEALRVLDRNNIDVVVLDVKMPGMSGIETLKRIQKMKRSVEVIMLTGHADIDVAMLGMSLGAFDYLLKPADIDELMFKIYDAHNNRVTV
ncbi:MAG: response regulator [Desulfovibrionales bacterium]|nr:response regulator [Desulfovibrionales bacterium]